MLECASLSKIEHKWKNYFSDFPRLYCNRRVQIVQGESDLKTVIQLLISISLTVDYDTIC